MHKRFVTILLVVMALVTLSQESLSSSITQLRQDLLKKFARFDAVVKDMTIQMESTILSGKNKKEAIKNQSKIFRKGPKVRIENRLKVDTGKGQIEEITTTIVYDGKDAYLLYPQGPTLKIEDIPKEQMDIARFIPEDASISKEEIFDGHPCYIVTFSESGVKCQLWIDKKRLIPLKMEQEGTTILFKDYRKVAGIWGLPYQIRMTSADTEVVSFLKDLKVNTGLPDRLFKVEATESKGIEEVMKIFGPIEK